MPAALESPSGTFEMNTAARTEMLTAPPPSRLRPEHHRLGDAVEEGAHRDGRTAAGLLVLRGLAPGALAVPGAAPGERQVRQDVDDARPRGSRMAVAVSPPVAAASSMRSKATAEMRTPEPNAITDATTFGGTSTNQATSAPRTSAPPPSRPHRPASSQTGTGAQSGWRSR